jgi:hypothetical protein
MKESANSKIHISSDFLLSMDRDLLPYNSVVVYLIQLITV